MHSSPPSIDVYRTVQCAREGAEGRHRPISLRSGALPLDGDGSHPHREEKNALATDRQVPLRVQQTVSKFSPKSVAEDEPEQGH